MFAVKTYDYGHQHTKRMDNTGGTSTQEVLYLGNADPGALESEAKWQIMLFEYDANDNVTAVKWAGGTNDFNKVWDSRASYTYK